jgi:hypothetical protein
MTRTARPRVLKLREVDMPVPQDDEVLVRVRAASVNQWDWDYVRGKPALVRLGGWRKPQDKILGAESREWSRRSAGTPPRFRAGDERHRTPSPCSRRTRPAMSRQISGTSLPTSRASRKACSAPWRSIRSRSERRGTAELGAMGGRTGLSKRRVGVRVRSDESASSWSAPDGLPLAAAQPRTRWCPLEWG